MIKYILVVVGCFALCSCGILDLRNPQLDNVPFEDYHPWWATNSATTNIVIANIRGN